MTHSGRRAALALLPAMLSRNAWGSGRASTLAADTVDVWVELDAAALGSLPRDLPPDRPREATRQREAQRTRIQAQQDAVMAQLAQLGGRELARVQLLRNALAVRLPVAALDAARRLPGVRAVRAVRDARRPPRIER